MISKLLWAFVEAMLVSAIFMPYLINYLKQHKEVAMIRQLGPDHSAKAGTPSMGGVLIILGTLIAVLLATFQSRSQLVQGLAYLFPVLAYGLIGSVDDIIKLRMKRDEGFRFIPKLTVQILAGVATFLMLQLSQHSTEIWLPWLGMTAIGGLAYFVLVVIWMVGWSNATNLTDGLDGLLGGLAMIAYGAYGLLAWHQGATVITIFSVAVIGGISGFMIWNKPKAKIFMGDTGSLALGAGLAIISIALGHPLSLLWFGFIFVIETLSVMIQVVGYRYFKKRIFPMAPLHHTFELPKKSRGFGMNDLQVDQLFWTVGLLIAVIGVVLYW